LTTNLWLWVAFNLVVAGMLALDLGVFHRRSHTVGVREALTWTAVWIGLAMAFNLGIYLTLGATPALEFLTGYLIEKSLSLDNIFVFVLIFGFFQVPARYQHRVLFWGVLGALAMRAGLIAAGAALLARFHWVMYAFGLFLVVTGVRMALQRHASGDLSENRALRLVRRLIPVTDTYHGERFTVREAGRRLATPLLLALVLLELSDLVFAVDSIPAIFAVTRDPFLVYTSNVFAILGLRSLYFLLAGVVGKFRYLKLGLSVVLSFVGAKMLLAEVRPVPIAVSLAVILGVLALSVILSLAVPEKRQAWADGLPAQGASSR